MQSHRGLRVEEGWVSLRAVCIRRSVRRDPRSSDVNLPRGKRGCLYGFAEVRRGFFGCLNGPCAAVAAVARGV